MVYYEPIKLTNSGKEAWPYSYVFMVIVFSSASIVYGNVYYPVFVKYTSISTKADIKTGAVFATPFRLNI